MLRWMRAKLARIHSQPIHRALHAQRASVHHVQTGLDRCSSHHGFRIIGRGVEPAWQLDDIEYAWVVLGSA
jgi:hypothetical protein